MADKDGVFLFIATYPDEPAAQRDYDVVRALHGVDMIGRFDAAVVTKDAKGKVHVNKDETSTRRGAWTGVAAGAALGILFRRPSSGRLRRWARPAVSPAICSVVSRARM